MAKNASQSFDKVYSQFSLAIVTYHIPQGMNGAKTIRQLRGLDEKMIFCGLSGDDSDLPFTGALDAGALVFVQKGIRAEKFFQQIKGLAMQYENQNGKLQHYSDTLMPNTENIKKIGGIGNRRASPFNAGETSASYTGTRN